MPYSQQYINTSLTTLGKSMFSCRQIYIDIYLYSFMQQNIQRDKTNELSHQILNITSIGNAKGKKLSQYSSRRLAR